MKTYNATDARKNLFNFFYDISKKHDSFRVKYKDSNIVMMNEDDYDDIIETIELLSQPGFKKKLAKAEKEIAKGDVFKFEEVFR